MEMKDRVLATGRQHPRNMARPKGLKSPATRISLANPIVKSYPMNHSGPTNVPALTSNILVLLPDSI
jgi:hypothetical protein